MNLYTHDITRAMDDSGGVSASDLKAWRDRLPPVLAALKKAREDNSLPVLSLADRADDLSAIEETASALRAGFDTIYILGMGASTLNGEACVGLAQSPFAAPRPVLHFIDNIDPMTFERLLEALDLPRSHFVVISKSGGTAETLAQTLILLERVATLAGGETAKHFTFVSMPDDNPLRRLAAAYRIPVLDHDPKIGGRFSGLTAVGLLPAALAGLDIYAFRRGAQTVVEAAFSPDSAPALGAALSAGLHANGRTISVLMPYCDRLLPFSRWHQQLWAESLGKQGYGLTAARAMGAVDQHSQLQLYLDGPDDKCVTFILTAPNGQGPVIPDCSDPGLSGLSGHTLGDLFAAEQQATVETLTRAHRPARVFSLPALNEETLGALMMHFMLETMILAGLWGIDAFDQPAVETGKILAREYLARGT